MRQALAGEASATKRHRCSARTASVDFPTVSVKRRRPAQQRARAKGQERLWAKVAAHPVTHDLASTDLPLRRGRERMLLYRAARLTGLSSLRAAYLAAENLRQSWPCPPLEQHGNPVSLPYSNSGSPIWSGGRTIQDLLVDEQTGGAVALWHREVMPLALDDEWEKEAAKKGMILGGRDGPKPPCGSSPRPPKPKGPRP